MSLQKILSIPNRPTHALYAVDNWDGEGDTRFVFAFEVDGVMYHYENGDPVLQYAGDRIINQWPLA